MLYRSLVCFSYIVASTEAVAPPTFPIDFYSGQQSALLINQGGYDVNGGSCCSQDAPQCKVQGVSMGQDLRQQGTMNRSRTDSAQGSIVTWGAPYNKQMALIPGAAKNSSHAWVCGAACPADGFLNAVAIGDPTNKWIGTPKDMGQAQVTQVGAPGEQTKTCERYHWGIGLGPIAMEKNDMYVDTGATPPVPFVSSVAITPFNGPKIGTENSSFVQFTPLKDFGTYFDIDPASIANCPPPQNGCGDQHTNAALAATPKAAGLRFRQTIAMAALDSLADGSLAAAARLPVLPKRTAGGAGAATANLSWADYTADEDITLLISQNGARNAHGDACCDVRRPGQCQVQSQRLKGTRYHDVTNQRTRFDDTLSGQKIVDDFVAHKSMLINVTGGVETCQEYCPLSPDDALDKFELPDDAKDKGQATIDGKTAEHYQWFDRIFKIIKMQSYDFYAVDGKPYFQTSAITPFGQPAIGHQNQSWMGFKPGAPDASKFKIAGMDTCPQSSNCGQSVLQAHRLATRQAHAFFAHQPAL